MAAGAGAKAEITAIKALLFDDRSGELSKDVLSQSDPDIPELQNITAWSHSTLVLVEISGPPKQLAASSRVNFVATYKAWTPGRDTPPSRQDCPAGRISRQIQRQGENLCRLLVVRYRLLPGADFGRIERRSEEQARGGHSLRLRRLTSPSLVSVAKGKIVRWNRGF